MNITEIRTKLVSDSSERLRAYCSITIDGDFVIRDLKIIDGPNGPFLAMPSRKLADRCQKCGAKNHLRARFCNECGAKLPENRAPRDGMGRSKLHADVAHPINAACRERIQKAVVEAFLEEVEASHSPDYKPIEYDEYDEDAGPEPEIVEEAEPVEEEPVAMDDAPDDDDDGGFGAGIDEFGSAARGGRDDRGQAGSTDYDSLIADLKRDAAGRRTDGGRDRGRDRRDGRRDERRSDGTETATPPRAENGARGRSDRDRDRGRQQGSRGRGDRRDDRRDARRDAPPRDAESETSQTRVAEAPRPAPKPATPPPPPPPKAEPPDDGGDDFGAGIF